EILKNNQELFLASKKYLNEYMNALEKHEQKIKDNLITEEQILDYLKDKKDLRIKLKQLIDDDLAYVRENHPEYLQKWKYYQEFERLCEND
ncbi:glycosyl transferase, partial [Campylobacter lari]|nr:glycosyl transferase [Campylobacter lari]